MSNGTSTLMTTLAGNISSTVGPSTTTAFDINDYKCEPKGLILPLVNEYTWSIGGRAFIYLLGLLWTFLAVAIIADVFMCSIERITSKTTKVRIADENSPDGFREVDVLVWNSTVANLSLLALGTSAPEILLSVIELIGNNFKAGTLGPGTIVGSAAFNLLVISGICVMAIPSPDIRRVAHMKVFLVTAFSCIAAYIWLALVLLVFSENVVDFWEAILTLLFFPLLIGVAYAADRNFCMGKKEEPSGTMVGFALETSMVRAEFKDARSYNTLGDQERGEAEDTRTPEANMMKVAKELGHNVNDGDVSENEAAKIAAAKLAEGQSHSRGWYRINATRMMAGGKKLMPHVTDSFQQLYDNLQSPEKMGEDKRGSTLTLDHSAGGTKAVCEFTAAEVSVLENEGKVRIGLRRQGKTDIPATIRVETCNGTAIGGSEKEKGADYVPFCENVTFVKGDCIKSIFITIVDDYEYEPDEFFFVKMSVPEMEDKSHERVALGACSICQVTIINDDEPGKLEFAKPSLVVKESFTRARIPVNRVNGADGHVKVAWKTKDITAVDGVDYKGGEGELEFDNQEMCKFIEIEMLETNKAERDECFQIELGETDGGATLGKITKTIVTIVNDEEFNGIVSRLINLTKNNLDALQLESHSWISQFVEAMNVNGGDIEGATFIDYVMHFLTFGWKIIFAFIPPPKYWGGYPAFLISLAVIGVLTAIIGDLAGIFGCLIGLPDSITAITLVALGTSMPDTFASKTAALGEKTADSSVGNVNGSNSVNVFLGLGLTWTIGTIYWWSKGEVFVVPAGDLAFSVVVYTVCAIVAIGILMLRRFVPLFGNAELGGPFVPKIVSGVILIFLWVLYVLLSSLQAKGFIQNPF